MQPTKQEIVEKYIKIREKCLIELQQVVTTQQEFKKPNHKYFALPEFEQEMLQKGLRNRKVELEQEINKCYRQIGRHSI